MFRFRVALAVLIVFASAMPGVAAAACRDLAQLRLPSTVIESASETSGLFASPPRSPRQTEPTMLDLPAICRVRGTIAPAIRFEIWLPLGNAFNGRLQTVGGGGLAGNFDFEAMHAAVIAGYASAATDTGHRASDSWWLGDPQRRLDYGSRAVHETTLLARSLTEVFYGDGPAYSYFNGCSTGGRQGLMEAQRYPGDYDGIISGAPVNDFTNLHMGQLWTAHATLIPEGSVLTADDLQLVNDRVMAVCDAIDGLADGILLDPRQCGFDPRELACSRRSGSQCLAEPKIAALEKIYAGAVNPRTGAQIYPGLEPGSENAQPNNPGWALIMNGETPFDIDISVIGGMGFENSAWDWRSFDFDRDVSLVNAKLAHVLNAVDPDLSEFAARGGKLIIWHGWNDPGVMPQRTIDYYEDVLSFADKATGGSGRAATDEYLRLYMLPGVGHCRGGVGPDKVDWIDTIVNWVENDRAPDVVIATRADDPLTRPVCPYPQVAAYRRGDPNDPASYRCE